MSLTYSPFLLDNALIFLTCHECPTADELPCSDDTPVDNELQELIPGLLTSILQILWADRMDWFFGIDMGVYYHPEQPAIVPDGFLSLGVERFIEQIN